MVLRLGSVEFVHNGKRWRRLPAEQDERYIVGLDLGQASDPTALCVLHFRKTPLQTWTPREDVATLRQDCETRYDVVHLERVKLGISYPEIVSYVAEVLERRPLCGRADLVIDDTGVGRAIGDLFEEAGLRPVRITITAGVETTRQTKRWITRWHVPKTELISNLDAKLHNGELRIAAELQEAGALSEELKDFRRHVSAAGRPSFQARVGAHDDLVLACSIACWFAAHPKPKLQIGSYCCGYAPGPWMSGWRGR